ncbi:MAG: heme biosynthesis HemY N-terminal domain-containing protein [Proteobacteria bacterium]|nr:heme biosynthesis HemY N-terminal domain-containing protein [Pseudomonadota bacterium]
MMRLLLTVLFLMIGYAALFYLFNGQGDLALVIGVWQLEIPTVQAIIIILSALLLITFIIYLIFKIIVYPRSFYSKYKTSREQKGLHYLRQTLVAITDGDTDEATKNHKQFKKYLGKDPLNKILQSQIKQSKELKIVNVEKGSG